MKIDLKIRRQDFVKWVLSAHGIFLIISIPAIFIFASISQPGWGLDEQVHTARAWQVSRLIMYPQRMSQGFYGGNIPAPLANLLEQGHTDSNSVDRAKGFFERYDLNNQETYNNLKSVEITSNTESMPYDFGPTGVYNPLPYAPAALGMRIASLLNLDTGSHIVFAKIMNAIFYISMLFSALYFARHTKVKWLIFVIGLLPTSLYQASIITADTFSIAVVLLFLSIVFTTLINERKIDKSTLWWLAISSLLLAFSKVNYVLLLSLLFLIPSARLDMSEKRARFVKIAYVSAAVLVGILLTVVSLKFVSATGYGGDVSPGGQLMWVLAHPIGALFALCRTIIVFGEYWVGSIVGLFGYNTVAVPNILSSLYFIVIFLAALATKPIPKKQALAILAIGGVVFISIIGTLYLSFTPVGKFVVDGIQGRYFIPCVPVIAYGLAKLLPFDMLSFKNKMGDSFFFGGSACLMVIVAVVAYGMAMYSF